MTGDARASTWSVRDAPEVARLLDLARAHLGTDIAFVSEFEHGEQVLRMASGDLGAMNMAVGEGGPMSGSYCVRVLAGTIPPVIPHARRHPLTRDLAATRDQRIGSYVGAPLHGPGGEVEGMVCCLSQHPDPGLDEASARFLGLVADLISDHLSTPVAVDRRALRTAADRIAALVAERDVRMVYQPVVELESRSTVAYEALSRFDAFVTPDLAFAAAARAGLGTELELMTLRRALEQLDRIPPDVLLAVNLSAEALASSEVLAVLLGQPRRLAVEITEHTPVTDYPGLRAVCDDLRAAGHVIVVDDAGAGDSSLRHVLELRPDIIKLDAELVHDVDCDPVRLALARSLREFAADIGARLVAEGVETTGELDALTAIGVPLAQGYLLGRPGVLPRSAPVAITLPDGALVADR